MFINEVIENDKSRFFIIIERVTLSEGDSKFDACFGQRVFSNLLVTLRIIHKENIFNFNLTLKNRAN